MSQQLSLATRPRTLDQLLGQEKLVKAIRGHMKSGRVIKAWLFGGPKGCGKTSVSRILSLSYQCRHQEVFGQPCQACRANKNRFDIVEINAAEETGKKDIQALLQGAMYRPMGAGRYRVYVIDECHDLSKAAKELLLKYTEDDTPSSTVFILCSTAPHLLPETLRRRCQVYELKELNSDAVGVLVKRLLKFANSRLPADRLTDALNEYGVRSPGLVAQAVEKYCAGNAPDDAAQVEGATSVDIRALGRSVVRGDWVGVSTYLKNAQLVDARPIRTSMIAFLRSILLDEPELGVRAKAVADTLDRLVNIHLLEDVAVAAALSAALYNATSAFQKHKH